MIWTDGVHLSNIYSNKLFHSQEKRKEIIIEFHETEQKFRHFLKRRWQHFVDISLTMEPNTGWLRNIRHYKNEFHSILNI